EGKNKKATVKWHGRVRLNPSPERHKDHTEKHEVVLSLLGVPLCDLCAFVVSSGHLRCDGSAARAKKLSARRAESRIGSTVRAAPVRASASGSSRLSPTGGSGIFAVGINFVDWSRVSVAVRLASETIASRASETDSPSGLVGPFAICGSTFGAIATG